MNQDSGWRKRQIALNKKAENACELGLDYEPDKREHMTDKKALKLALETLEMYELETNSEFQRKAITAIKKALAQPEQELVDYKKLADLGWQAIECCICGGGAMGYPQRTKQKTMTCNHEWVDDTKLKPQWRCAKCGIEYTKEKNT
jgi:hypothetical protein